MQCAPGDFIRTAVNTEASPEAELVRWKSFDGKMISGFLCKPAAKFSGKRPVLVDIHGGPEGQSTPDFLGRMNYYLNEMGIAIIEPNVRGSMGYGKTFTLLDNGSKREDALKTQGTPVWLLIAKGEGMGIGRG
jgi:dipeptidyl aminopeptidase/acylaminoacyl peptidase